MPTDVTVPDIGDFDAVPIIEIHISVGDVISPEDPLITLESDKAAMDVPSPVAGTVKEIKVAVGDEVKQGSLILTVDADAAAEASPAEKPEPKHAPAPETASAPKAAPPPTVPMSSGGAQPQPGGAGVDIPDRVYPLAGKSDFSDFSNAHASPSVRRAARELDVDLNQVTGTGEKGRITKDDLKRHLSGGGGSAAATGGAGIPAVPAIDFSKFGEIEEVEMSRIQKISGPALHRSWLNIPHVTHNDEADITETDKFRKQMDTKAKTEGYRITLLSFIIKASVAALREHWKVNASLHPDGDKLIRKHYYNIGFAADTPDGLVVPVIKDADRKGIVEISKELGELSAKARDGKLGIGDITGASFTISSLGGIGGTTFTPIVNAPEVAILGVSRSKMTPEWNGEEFVPRNMLPLSLSYDHRAIDGALAARFCVTLKTAMTDIRNMLL